MKQSIILSAVVASLSLSACGDDVVVKSPDDHDHHEEHAADDADRAADKADRAADKADEAADDAAAAKENAD
jgi:hypothetical protein